jgi:hypothetical protein
MPECGRTASGWSMEERSRSDSERGVRRNRPDEERASIQQDRTVALAIGIALVLITAGSDVLLFPNQPVGTNASIFDSEAEG